MELGTTENFMMKNNRIELVSDSATSTSIIFTSNKNFDGSTNKIHDNDIIVSAIGAVGRFYSSKADFYNNDVTINLNGSISRIISQIDNIFRNNEVSINGNVDSIGYVANNLNSNTFNISGTLRKGFEFYNANLTTPVSIMNNTVNIGTAFDNGCTKFYIING